MIQEQWVEVIVDELKEGLEMRKNDLVVKVKGDLSLFLEMPQNLYATLSNLLNLCLCVSFLLMRLIVPHQRH